MVSVIVDPKMADELAWLGYDVMGRCRPTGLTVGGGHATVGEARPGGGAQAREVKPLRAPATARTCQGLWTSDRGGKLSPSWNGNAARTAATSSSLVAKEVDFAQEPSIGRGQWRDADGDRDQQHHATARGIHRTRC